MADPEQPLSVSSVTAICEDYGITASTAKLPFLAAGLINSAVAVLLTELSSKFFEMALYSNPGQLKSTKAKQCEDKLEEDRGRDDNEINQDEQDKADQQLIVNTLMESANKATATTTSTSTESSAFLATIPCSSDSEMNDQSTSSILQTGPKNMLHNSIGQLAPTGLQPIDMNSFGNAPIFPSSTMGSTNEPKDLSVEIKQESNEECLPLASHYSTMFGPSSFANFTSPDIGQHSIPNYPNHSSSHLSLTSSSSSSQPPVARITTVDYLKRHICNFRGCNKIFFSRSSLSCHKQIHAINKPHMCMYPGCGLTFASEALLITHSQLHESKQIRDRHSCSFPGCSKVFVSRDCLIEHTRIHTGERPFACDYPGCSHRFARRCNLFAHKRVHLDKNQRRQYHCIHPGCDKTFLYARSLSEHMNVHLGERPYVCDFPGCFKSFTSKSYLYAHRRIHLCSDKTFNNLTSQDESSSIAPIPVTVTIPLNQMNQTQFQAFMPNPSSISDSSMLAHHFYPSQPG